MIKYYLICKKMIDYSSNNRYVGLNYYSFRSYRSNRTIIYKNRNQNHKIKMYKICLIKIIKLLLIIKLN